MLVVVFSVDCYFVSCRLLLVFVLKCIARQRFSGCQMCCACFRCF